MNIEKWIDKNTLNLSGKVVAITGATGGLGSDLCFDLLKLNASIIMLNRNVEKSLSLKNKLLEQFPNANIEIIKLDLNEIKEVKEITNKLKNIKLDYLILNAGVYNVPLKKTELGYNNIFIVNFISPYYLIKTLLPTLKQNKTKLIVVGSIAHKYSKLNENDIDFSSCKRPIKIYGNSKRFLMASLYELFKKEEINFAITHPGVTLTNMTSHYHKSINWIVKFGMKILFPSSKKAVLNLLLSMFQNCSYYSWIGPNRFNIWGSPKLKKINSITLSESEKIYSLAEDICNKI